MFSDTLTAILEHSEQLKKPGLKLLQNPECLSVEIMNCLKFKVSLWSGCQISVVVSDVLAYVIKKNSTNPFVYFFYAPFDMAT